MTYSELFSEIIEDACQLVRNAADKRRQTVQLSPEVAALLKRVGATDCPATPPQFEADVAGESAATYGDSVESNAAGLEALAQEVSECAACGLARTRSQTVFGTGNPNAKLVFVGEAPGADEDRQGKPFVGKAGQLLTDIIEKGMGISRNEVFICNVLKCRPPDNRDPNPDEVAACERFLIEQLALIKPRVICALGGHAAKTLLQTEASVGQLRGKWHWYHGIPLRVTYHPAYLLRSPDEKRKTWMDVLEVMKVYRGEVTP